MTLGHLGRPDRRTISSINDADTGTEADESSRSAESETTVSTGTYLPDQRWRAGLAWNLYSVTREGTALPEPIHRFQALLSQSPRARQRDSAARRAIGPV